MHYLLNPQPKAKGDNSPMIGMSQYANFESDGQIKLHYYYYKEKCAPK